MKNKVKIIAEAGVNHNGKIKLAYKLARIAKKSGADFVKFQFFIGENLASKRWSFKQKEKKPALFEHFGISIVEAMTAGAVPIVFGAGGPLEIVRHGVDGFHWGTPDDLIEKTQLLINDTNLRTRLSNNAIKRATLFGKNQYEEKVQSLFSFE